MLPEPWEDRTDEDLGAPAGELLSKISAGPASDGEPSPEEMSQAEPDL